MSRKILVDVANALNLKWHYITETELTGGAFFGHRTSGMSRKILAEVANSLTMTWHYATGRQMKGSTLDAFCKSNDIGIVCYTNAKFNQANPSAFSSLHMVRDPRDLLVSAYFSHRYSHPTNVWLDLALQRAKLESLSVEDGLLSTLDFIAPTYRDLDAWDYANGHSIEVKFEDMTADFDRFCSAFSAMGLVRTADGESGLSRAELEAIYDRHSFKALSRGRDVGQQDVKSHYRKGQPGEHRDFWSPKLEARFMDVWGHLLGKMGYPV